MKKLILPLLLLVAFGMLAAVESDPSEVVGYFKKTVSDGAFQAIGLPFAYSSLTVNDVIGNQFTDGDAIQDINSGFSTFFYTGFGWDGDLAAFEYGGGYYVNRGIGNGSTDYYILGKVDPQASTVTVYGNGAFTALSLNEATAVAINSDPIGPTTSLFGANASPDDVVQEIDSGFSTIFYDGYGWDGDLQAIAPTFAYYYNTAVGAPTFVWNYTPTRGTVSQPVFSNSKSK